MTAAPTIGEALAGGRRALAEAGIESAQIDGRLLLEAAAGIDAAEIVGHPERPLDAAAADRFDDLVARRRAREPMSQILGKRSFWKADFAVTRDVLTPRPESETVIEAALMYFEGRAAPARILDLGTGSGCLLASLLMEFPDAAGLGIDASPAAAAVAAANLARLGLAGRGLIAVGDWSAAAGGPFDLIVCNPPYVTDGEYAALTPEVRDFEPARALVAGPEGADAMNRLLPAVRGLLAPGGAFVLEVGAGQAAQAKSLMEKHELAYLGTRADLAGIERCLLATVENS